MNRVYLRPLQMQDAPQILASTEDEEIRYFTSTTDHFTVEAIEAFIMRAATDRSRMDFAICHKETDALLGEVSLLDVDEKNKRGAMRISLHSLDDANKGYGTEAMLHFIRYVFEDVQLNRLELQVLAYNPRAKRVYEKVGFVVEGIAREATFYNGRFVDEIHMSMLKSDYDRLYR
ncbi:MAG: GNAT family N-acetyltransferase [Caryophanon sp.]|nr:GNAT family N-acetyltransferase [Caryophanon sp.]